MSIDLRPAVVTERGRFGDWEGDLAIGAGRKQALVALNERTARYTLIAPVPNKTAQAVSDAMISDAVCSLRSHILSEVATSADNRQREGVRSA